MAGGLSKNPYEKIHQGYTERDRYSTINKVEYIHNLSSLLKGLELRGNVSLSKTGLYAQPYETTPYVYSLRSYDEETGVHVLNAENPDKAQRTLTLGEETNSASTQLTYEARLYHTAAWKAHQTSVTAVFNAMQGSSSPITSVLNGMERRNMGLSMRGT